MIRYRVDTNALVRWLDFSAADHLVAENAINPLLAQNDVICVTTQNLIEFWSVATRPANVNGLNWDTVKTRQQIEQLLIRFQFLNDLSVLYDSERKAGLGGSTPNMARWLGDIPFFTCTPDLFPKLIAATIKRKDISQWAAARDIVMAGNT